LRKSGGDWTWSDGSTLNYTNWYPGLPDGTGQGIFSEQPDGTGDCANIHNDFPSLNGQKQYAIWLDVGCSETLPFFCKEQ